MTSSGRRLQLGKVLGKGGEAKIFHVEGDSSIALKIYTDGKELDRRGKVNAMIADRLHNRTPFVAFPLETVTANGSFAGFTMRKAVGAKLMHQLCRPGDRKTEFPDANFRFLVRVALNFARAIASINNLGAVIGDINESGALVDQKGLVTIIDSDSFHYVSGGQLFRCRVGKPEYTPPELQGQSFEKVDRTVNHDAFGVAVIIFEILFMGRHPFSGVYKGTGDQLSISRAIQEGRFAYSQHRSLTQMEPPPHVPVLADITIDMAAAFQRAFGSPTLKVQARFFQAEGGIRDWSVTGVQTCALPILPLAPGCRCERQEWRRSLEASLRRWPPACPSRRGGCAASARVRRRRSPRWQGAAL